VSLPVRAAPAFSKPAHAKLVLRSPREGPTAPSTLVFALRSTVTSRPPLAVKAARGVVYAPSIVELDVKSSARSEGSFLITLVPMAPGAPSGANVPLGLVDRLAEDNPSPFFVSGSGSEADPWCLPLHLRPGYEPPVANVDASLTAITAMDDETLAVFVDALNEYSGPHGPRALLDAGAQPGADTPVWTFLGPRPAGWWIRRRLHETAVHRADAALALGVGFDIDPAVAADAVTEYLERAVVRAGAAGGEVPVQDGQSLHLHATDPGLGAAGEWTIRGRPGGIAVGHDHGKATAALRGPARDLLLAIVRRGVASELGLEMFGDHAVWDTWLARTPF
jgi:uncharacterized protein (TIGR03083 family)